uniref:HTH_48 domain-containing protein n=1 Tax=Strongyloides stercoralis TaxID=6248 RepID=A0A0K0EC61_STRER
MSNFVSNKEQLRTALIFCFHLEKIAAESYQLFQETYGERVPLQDTCEQWFRRFKSGDFDVTDKKHGKPPKKYEDSELQALLYEDDAQTQKQLAKQLSLLKPGETINAKRYQQQLIDLGRLLLSKRPEYQQRQHKVILFHDNAPSHKTKLVHDTLEALKWEVLPHAAYSPDLALFDYHLFASMGHALAEQRFCSYEDVKK